ncbi:MAG: signal peptidase I [Oscillospiraceae bacterium]|nr:signal peptidase I [Oscillospiraceae bacterium]
MAQKNKEKTSNNKIMTVIGAILCVILIPILAVNITLIIKSYTNADEVPKIGGFAPLIVLSPSMEPNIMTGDLIIVKQTDGKDVKKNDVIAFFDPDGNGTSILTHRVNEIYEENGVLYFKTQGDANDSEDRLPVSEDKLVGVWSGTRIPGAGSVAMFMQTTAGLVVCVGVPLILLVAWDIFRRRRYEKKNQTDTDALLAELEALKAAKAEQQNNSENQ